LGSAVAGIGRPVPSAWASIALVVGIGLAITAVAFATINRADERRVVKTLELRVEWRAADLEAKIKLAGRG
jgi:hypothetical protein